MYLLLQKAETRNKNSGCQTVPRSYAFVLEQNSSNITSDNGSYFEYRRLLKEHLILCNCSIARIAGHSKRTSVVWGFGNCYHTYFGRIHKYIYSMEIVYGFSIRIRNFLNQEQQLDIVTK